MTAEEFRNTHGAYPTWTDEAFDLYFAIITAPEPQPAPTPATH